MKRVLYRFPFLFIGVFFAADFRLNADTAAEVEFFSSLQEIEAKYVKSIRNSLTKAIRVEIYRIDPEFKTNNDPFGKDTSNFRIRGRDDEIEYEILKRFESLEKPDQILVWSELILPREELAFAMCVPHPGFAIRFFGAGDAILYETTICLKCHSATMNYPKYESRIGIDAPKITGLLLEMGAALPTKQKPNNP